MKLSLFLKLLLPVTMLTLVSCTLTISSAQDPEQGTGLGSGVVNIADAEGNLLATCTVTNGVAQADCIQEIEPGSTVVLKPVAAGGSEFWAWTGSGPSVPPGEVTTTAIACSKVVDTECTIVFDNPLVTTVNVTAYFKRLPCQGTSACVGLDNSPPGEGSCNGSLVCNGANGPIGNNSCNGSFACSGAKGSIGNNSCAGSSACSGGAGAVGDNSCNSDAACDSAAGPVGNNSCNNIVACAATAGAVGDNSCNSGSAGSACFSAGGPVGDNSCNDIVACAATAGAVGDNSCNGAGACLNAAGAVGDNSCNTTGSSCRDATEDIGDCMYNDVKPDACP